MKEVVKEKEVIIKMLKFEGLLGRNRLWLFRHTTLYES